MKIVSNFKDYYDSAVAYASDPSVTYVRRGQARELDAAGRGLLTEVFGSGRVSLRTSDRLYAARFVVLVAGRLYRGLRLAAFAIGSQGTQSGIRTQACLYSWDAVQEFLARAGMNVQALGTSRFGLPAPERELNRWLSQQGTSELEQWAVKNQVVCAQFLSADAVFELNPCLGELELYRLMPASLAYQEVAMYVGGVLPQAGAPSVAIPDEAKVVKHGFDRKTSFRTAAKPSRKEKRAARARALAA